jgi:hypothetical protein
MGHLEPLPVIPQDPLMVKGKGRPKGATTTVAPTTQRDTVTQQPASQRGVCQQDGRDFSCFEHIQVTQETQDGDDEEVVNVQVNVTKRRKHKKKEDPMQEIKNLLHRQYSAIEDRFARIEDQQFTSINNFLVPTAPKSTKKHTKKRTIDDVDLTDTAPGDLLATYQPRVTKKPCKAPEVAKKPCKKRATKAEMAARRAALATPNPKAQEKVCKVATAKADKPGMRQTSPFSISSLESESSNDEFIS